MREGGGEIRPAGGRSHGAGARGSRAARPAGGDAGPDRASHARKGNSEGPHAGLCLLGRTRRRVGGLRSMRSPSDRSKPAGQQEASRSEEEDPSRAPAWQKKTRGAIEKPHAVKKKTLAAHPLGKTQPSRSGNIGAGSKPAGQGGNHGILGQWPEGARRGAVDRVTLPLRRSDGEIMVGAVCGSGRDRGGRAARGGSGGRPVAEGYSRNGCGPEPCARELPGERALPP